LIEKVKMRQDRPTNLRTSHHQADTVLRLGWISLLNDVSGEAIARVLPLFMAGVLGAPMSAIGWVEGIAESTSTLVKPAFGRLSDRLGKRKDFIFWGYALSAIARPFLSIVGSVPEIGFLRFCDRFGKGVRTGARDALIAESSDFAHRQAPGARGNYGRSFGLNRAMDTAGALLSVAGFTFWVLSKHESAMTAASWRLLCLTLALPGLAALALIAWGIRDVPSDSEEATTRHRARARLPGELYRYIGVVGVFTLANSSDAFILLRSRELGFTLPGTLGLVMLNTAVAALSSLPASLLSERWGRRSLIAMGWTVYALCYGVLGSPFANRHSWIILPVVAVYGLFYGFTDSVERAWVADLAPQAARGRAYGLFGLVTGLVALPASALFGWAWERWGSSVPFLGSSAIALFATSLLFFCVRGRPTGARAG
jgi:MFS family permease